ncbi:9725_t:CDS:2, partial [Dentiscutata erythropus]
MADEDNKHLDERKYNLLKLNKSVGKWKKLRVYSFQRLVIAAAICAFSLGIGCYLYISDKDSIESSVKRVISTSVFGVGSTGILVKSLTSLKTLFTKKKDVKIENNNKENEIFGSDIVKKSTINCPRKLDSHESSPILFVKALIEHMHIMMIWQEVDKGDMNKVYNEKNDEDIPELADDIISFIMTRIHDEDYHYYHILTNEYLIGILVIIKLMARYLTILHDEFEKKRNSNDKGNSNNNESTIPHDEKESKNNLNDENKSNYSECVHALLGSINACMDAVFQEDNRLMRKGLKKLYLLKPNLDSKFRIYYLSDLDEKNYIKKSIAKYFEEERSVPEKDYKGTVISINDVDKFINNANIILEKSLEIYQEQDHKDNINLKKTDLKKIENTLEENRRHRNIMSILSEMTSDGKLYSVNKMMKTLKTLLENLLGILSVGDENGGDKIKDDKSEDDKIEVNKSEDDKIEEDKSKDDKIEEDKSKDDKIEDNKSKGDKSEVSLEEILMPIIILKIKANEKDKSESGNGSKVNDTWYNDICHKNVEFLFKPKVECKDKVSLINKMVEILLKLIRDAENNEKDVNLYIKNLELISKFIDNLLKNEDKVKSIMEFNDSLLPEELNIVVNILRVFSGITNKTKSDDKKFDIISRMTDMLTEIVMKRMYKEGKEAKLEEKDMEVVSSIIEIFSNIISKNYNATIMKDVKEPENLFVLIKNTYEDIDNNAKNFTQLKRIVLEIIELMIKAMIKKDTYTEYKASHDKMNKLNVVDAKIRAILSEVTDDNSLNPNNIKELDNLKTHLVSIRDDAIMEKYFNEKIDIFKKINSKKINWFKKLLLYLLTIIFLPTLFLTGLISLKNEDKEYAEYKYHFKKYKEEEPYGYKKIKWEILWNRLKNDYR